MKTNHKKSLITAACFVTILVALAINSALSANQQQWTPPPKIIQYPSVSISVATPISHHATVSAYGEVTSRNQLNLTSQVSGKIIKLSDNFLTGNTFKKGQLIAKIEPIVYEQILANAQSSLADAQLALAQEELNSNQAAQEWQQSGLAKQQPSDLVLRKPQLAAAKAKYKVAKKEVQKAIYDLAQTRIIAPFDALVVSKKVQMGSNIQAGTEIATLYDVALFEVSLPLSQHQWQLLPNTQQSSGLSITLTQDSNENRWTASMSRVEQHINGKSRQRSLIVKIENPLALSTPLFPGTFVKATLSGNNIDNLWKLPASALIDNNTVWQVSDDNLLSHLKIDIMFSQDNTVYVKPINGLSKARIVNRPLSSYLVNMKVAPNVEEIL